MKLVLIRMLSENRPSIDSIFLKACWIVLAILFIGFPFAGAFAAAGAMKIWEWLGRLEKWSRRKVLKARYLKTD